MDRCIVLLFGASLPLVLAPVAPSASTVPASYSVTHEPSEGDWSVAQTTNFRIYHRHGKDYAARAARVAEEALATAQRKWLGGAVLAWRDRCELYLYASPEQYEAATGAPPDSPGHTNVATDGERVISRSIHLHGTNGELLRCVLPHEVTHAVLSSWFGVRPPPRWADEGMAVLAEPRDRVDGHLRLLSRWRADGRLLPLRRLVEMQDYPSPERVPAFYAQSVSVVKFLVAEKGPQTFARFVRDGLRDGNVRALKRHYNWDFADLERRWREHAFGDDE